MNPVGEHIFTVQPFEVDFRGKLTFPLLINNLLNAAGHHANDRGFGIQQLNEIGKTWVLSRIAMEITRLPESNDNVKIETWIESVMRSFTFRNFAIYSNDECIGYARTIWAMIDMNTRKTENLEDKGIDQYAFKEKTCEMDKIGKIAVPENLVLADTFRVKYSDLDINRHLNSAKYIEHIFDAFSTTEISENAIRKFEIEYIEECLYGETIQIFRDDSCSGSHILLLKNEKGENTCKCRISN